jgi:hypothetical protein
MIATPKIIEIFTSPQRAVGLLGRIIRALAVGPDPVR